MRLELLPGSALCVVEERREQQQNLCPWPSGLDKAGGMGTNLQAMRESREPNTSFGPVCVGSGHVRRFWRVLAAGFRRGARDYRVHLEVPVDP
jgi:hypothetical protein